MYMPDVWFDLQKGQATNASDNYPMPSPALLVEFRQMRYEPLSRGQQMCKLELSLYYYTWLGDTFSGSESEADSLEILEAGSVLHTCFGNFADGFAPLERTAQQIVAHRGPYMVLRVDYSTAFKDVPPPEPATGNTPELQLNTN